MKVTCDEHVSNCSTILQFGKMLKGTEYRGIFLSLNAYMHSWKLVQVNDSSAITDIRLSKCVWIVTVSRLREQQQKKTSLCFASFADLPKAGV